MNKLSFFIPVFLILMFCGEQTLDAAENISLPEGIQWITNTDYPEYTSPDAKRGGTFRNSISTYPQTTVVVFKIIIIIGILDIF